MNKMERDWVKKSQMRGPKVLLQSEICFSILIAMGDHSWNLSVPDRAQLWAQCKVYKIIFAHFPGDSLDVLVSPLHCLMQGVWGPRQPGAYTTGH